MYLLVNHTQKLRAHRNLEGSLDIKTTLQEVDLAEIRFPARATYSFLPEMSKSDPRPPQLPIKSVPWFFSRIYGGPGVDVDKPSFRISGAIPMLHTSLHGVETDYSSFRQLLVKSIHVSIQISLEIIFVSVNIQ